MSKVLANEGLDLIFRDARTHNVWRDEPVDDALLRQVYDLAKMGPTSRWIYHLLRIGFRTDEAML